MSKYFILISALLLVGCSASSRQAPAPSAAVLAELGSIAVVPFENYSGNANAGLIVADQLTSELLLNTKLHIIEPEKVRQALAPHAGEMLTAAKVAEVTSATTVVTGTVSEYRYKTGISQKPSIGLTLAVIDTRSGAIIWSANSARASASFFGTTGLSTLTQEICAELVAQFLSHHSTPPTTGDSKAAQTATTTEDDTSTEQRRQR